MAHLSKLQGQGMHFRDAPEVGLRSVFVHFSMEKIKTPEGLGWRLTV
jgi:hypothetical protein